MSETTTDVDLDARERPDPRDDDRDLTTGPVWTVLARIAAPMVLGLIAVLSVGLVDTFFVGKLGKDQLAALSFAFPVAIMLTGLCIGLGVGTASVVSRRTGEGRDDAARQASLYGVLLAALITSIVSLGLALLTRPLFDRLGASAAVLDHIVDYMPIYFISVPFLSLSIVLHNISRAVGEANWPTAIMLASGCLNIALTAALVFGVGPVPGFGILGAALGTVLARLCIVPASLWLVTKKLGMIHWHLPKFYRTLSAWREILKIAAPSGGGNMVNPISNIVITAILAGFAQTAVAGFGIATQVQSIATIPLLAMSSAIGPIAGQNWGANKPDRIVSTLKWAFGLCLAWAAIIGAGLWVFGAPIAGVFSNEADVTENAASYLRIVPISLFGFGMLVIGAAAFNAVDQAARGLAVYLLRACVFFLPLAFIGSILAQARGVYIGMAVANGLAGLIIAAYVLRWFKRNQDLAGEQE